MWCSRLHPRKMRNGRTVTKLIRLFGATFMCPATSTVVTSAIGPAIGLGCQLRIVTSMLTFSKTFGLLSNNVDPVTTRVARE